jgi:RHS repeat-associated protein
MHPTTYDNRFKYNAKELEDDHNLYWYHYGARYYDPQLGRWHVVDQSDEFYSPYVFVGNHPTLSTDKDGMWEKGAVDFALANLGGKKYGNCWTVVRQLKIRKPLFSVSDYDELVITKGFTEYNPDQIVCNQFVIAAFKGAGYSDFGGKNGTRVEIKTWFNNAAAGRRVIEGNSLNTNVLNNLEIGDLLNYGLNDPMKGHMYMITEKKIVEGAVKYRIIESAKSTGTESVNKETWIEISELNRQIGKGNFWIGRIDINILREIAEAQLDAEIMQDDEDDPLF